MMLDQIIRNRRQQKATELLGKVVHEPHDLFAQCAPAIYILFKVRRRTHQLWFVL
jgi:hypothetical protein